MCLLWRDIGEGLMNNLKQNQTPRDYFDQGGFEIRIGKFYDPNSYHNGDKMEIRILRKFDYDKLDENMDIFYSLVNIIKEFTKSVRTEP